MLVSHRKNFIFFKTVKTAGTSVESYFERWCLPEGEWQQLHGREEHISVAGIVGKRATRPSDAKWYNHMSSSNIRKQLDQDIWNRYFKFTIVRNPFDKLVSGFFMFNGPLHNAGYLQRINRYALKLLGREQSIIFHSREEEIRCFRSWLQYFSKLVLKNLSLIEAADVPHYLKPIELSLVDRDKYLIDSKECVDFFIQFENLSQGIKHVCDKLSIPFEAQRIPEFKKGVRHHRIPMREYYDKKSQELVQELYAWEISRFGYVFPE